MRVSEAAGSAVGDLSKVGGALKHRAGRETLIERATCFFLAAFFFTFPLESVGVDVVGYPMSLPFVCLLAVSGLVVLQGEFRLLPLVTGGAFLVWALATNVGSSPLESFIFSVAVLFIIWIPLMKRLDVSGVRELAVKWFIRGVFLSFLFVYYDLFINMFGWPPLSEVLPFFGEQRTREIGGILRVKAAMTEPAYYAVYLSFVYVVVDRELGNAWTRRFLKLHVVGALLLAQSLSGISLLLFYLSLKAVFHIRRSLDREYLGGLRGRLARPRSVLAGLRGRLREEVSALLSFADRSQKISGAFLLVFLILSGSLLASLTLDGGGSSQNPGTEGSQAAEGAGDPGGAGGPSGAGGPGNATGAEQPGAAEKMAARVSGVYEVIESGSLSGSAGTRLNSVRVPFTYWNTEGWDAILTGLGFGNIDQWLQNTYEDVENSSMSRGSVQNAFVYLGLSTGVVGLLLYLAFVFSAVSPRSRNMPWIFFLLWLFTHFATAHLITYALFGYLYLYGLSETRRASNDFASPPGTGERERED